MLSLLLAIYQYTFVVLLRVRTCRVLSSIESLHPERLLVDP
jgi:hypothetical protein